jgi:non-heme chloroperoxidase
MHRRDVLKSVASATAGAGLILARDGAAETQGKRPAVSRRVPGAPFIETGDGTSLFYRDWGAGDPVVFTHAWGLSSEFWQYQMVALTGQGLRCVAYDRRSHGRSSDPGRGYDYDTLADDLAALVERLDLRHITLVGHSMGGGEVVRYLSRHGAHRVARVVLVAATLPLIAKAADYSEGVDRRAFDGLRAALSTDRAKWLADNRAPFWLPTTSSAMMDWGNAIALQCSLKALIDSTYTMAETGFRNELRVMAVPTLIVHGTEDRSVPIAFGRLTARLIPGCQLREYEGAPHGLPITHLERFNGDLLAFLKG